MSASAVRFEGEVLIVELTDGRCLSIPYRKIPHLAWLAQATPEQRNDWSLEPGGHAIYWNQLEDGLAVWPLVTGEAFG